MDKDVHDLIVYLIACGVVASFTLLAIFGTICAIVYAIKRVAPVLIAGAHSCGRFLAWRFSTKQMRKEVAAVYTIAFLYAGAFLVGNFPSTRWEWIQFLVLCPWSWYAVYDDVRAYLSQPSHKPAYRAFCFSPCGGVG